MAMTFGEIAVCFDNAIAWFEEMKQQKGHR